MHVGLFTYQTGHLKTVQMIQQFLVRGYTISLFAFPFKKRARKQRPFEERPDQLIDCDLPRFCQACGVHYHTMLGWNRDSAAYIDQLTDKPDIMLTVIAKIIPDYFLDHNIILNCHPGILPDNRGVDAFKWAILKGAPTGITLHRIDAEIDAGMILKTVPIPLLKTDTYATFCQRAYQMECDLQASFEQYLSRAHTGEPVDRTYSLSKAKIPASDDLIFDQHFDRYRQRLGQ